MSAALARDVRLDALQLRFKTHDARGRPPARLSLRKPAGPMAAKGMAHGKESDNDLSLTPLERPAARQALESRRRHSDGRRPDPHG